MYTIPKSYIEYVKTLGIEWNANLDHFRVTVLSHLLVVLLPNASASDIARTFDVLRWFSPSIIKIKNSYGS